MKIFILWILFGLGNTAVFLLKDRFAKKTRRQVMFVLVTLLIFSLSNIRHCVAYSHNQTNLIISIVSSVVFLAGLFFGIRQDRELIRFNRRQGIIFAVILIVFMVTSFSLVYIYPLWDAACYTDTINVATALFDYGLNTHFQDYFLCGHISLGYTFVLLIGDFIWNGNAGVLLIQVILGALSVCAFYETLYTLKRTRMGEKVRRYDPVVLALTCLYMFSPAVFGMAGDLSVDYGMLCFLPFVILAIVKGWNYLGMLFGMAFCMTKEPAIILYGGIVGTLFLFEIRQKNFRKWAFQLAPAAAFAYLFFMASGWSNNVSTGGGTNAFGIDISFVNNKLKQIQYMNFDWLLILCVLLALALAITAFVVRKIKKQEKQPSLIKYAAAMVVSYVAYIAFSCLYVTASHYRYIMIITYGLALLLAVFLFSINRFTIIKTIFVSALSILLLIQSFVNIDLLSASKFHNITTSEDGKKQITLSDVHDGIIYNRSYCSYIRLIEKALFQAGIDGQTVIVIPSGYTSYKFSGFAPHGFYLDYTHGHFAYGAAEAQDHLTEWNGRIFGLSVLKDIDTSYIGKVICVDFPWAGLQAEEELKGLVDVSETFRVSEGQWDAIVYVGTVHVET